MSNSLIELIKEYGDMMHSHGATPFREYDEEAADILAEIRDYIEALEQPAQAPDYSVTQLTRLKALMGRLGLATDESLEGFCLDADRQLSRAITATEDLLQRTFAAPPASQPIAVLPEGFVVVPKDEHQAMIQGHKAAAAFFGWFNRHYPGDDRHEDHPWCRLGAELGSYEAVAAAPSPTIRTITEQELAELERDAGRYRWLRDNINNSLSLSRNEDHACNYVTAKQWIEEYAPENFAEVEPEELQRMKDTNTIWRLQIYPDTPVGFYVWHGATPDAAIDAAIAQQEPK